MTPTQTEKLTDERIAARPPFAVGDIVQTTKDAKFWGEVVSTYQIKREYEIVGGRATGDILPGLVEWRIDVRAIAPDFLGTIHVYPATQLELRAAAPAEPGGWRDMASAPKSGEVLLRVKARAGVQGGFLVGHFMEGGHSIEDHPPIRGGWYFWNGCRFDEAAEPIAWMPLPPLPAAPTPPATDGADRG